MSTQDWEPVVLRNAAKVAAAKRSTEVKRSEASVTALKIDNSETPVRQKILTPESRQIITSMRAALKLTQVELNQRCQFPANTIRDIESGKYVPSNSQLNILRRIIKCIVKLE
jgi:ribosome-binding protein aMBF1 (putative translation factor)